MVYNTRSKTISSFDVLFNKDELNNHKENKKKKIIKDNKKSKLVDNDEETLRNLIKTKILTHFIDLENETDNNSELYDTDENQFYNSLPKQKQKIINKIEKQIGSHNKQYIPYRFRVLCSKLPLEIKSIIIEKLDQFSMIDPSETEYHKLNKWLTTFFNIPFNTYTESKITTSDDKTTIKNFLVDTKHTLDSVIYGHSDAKNEIIQYLCNIITNPESNGKILALQGPPGNGKTTLIKKGVAKALNKPFGFIALGGAQDSSLLDGFDYTYEGSKCGRIIEILQKSKSMDPIIYFDELDKISDTPKGEEIVNLLCHIIDQSQNNTYRDRYLSEIDIDLSKVTFIFSFNNEQLINPILKDRLNIIHTDGYTSDDKIKICNKFLIPEALGSLNLIDKIIFNNESIRHIISNYTNDEKGVRELKRSVETICSKINLYDYYNESVDDNNDKHDDEKFLPYVIKDFKYPITLTTKLINKLLNKKKKDNTSINHIYM